MKVICKGTSCVALKHFVHNNNFKDGNVSFVCSIMYLLNSEVLLFIAEKCYASNIIVLCCFSC